MFAATDGPLLGVNAWGDEDPEPTDEPEGFIDECDELATPEEVLTKLEQRAADLVLATLPVSYTHLTLPTILRV